MRIQAHTRRTIIPMHRYGQSLPRWRSAAQPPEEPQFPGMDVNTLSVARDHFSSWCKLHETERLLTTIPVLAGRMAAVNPAFLRTKAEFFPHSWNAVWRSPFLPEGDLVAERSRLLVLCCPRCRQAAAHYLRRCAISQAQPLAA